MKKLIEELEMLEMKATPSPWYVGDVFTGDCGEEYCPIGPYDMSDKEDKHPYEDTIAEFWNGEHDAETNAKFVVAAVNAVPILISRIKELEQLKSTGLSADVEAAIDTLNKWRKNPQN